MMCDPPLPFTVTLCGNVSPFAIGTFTTDFLASDAAFMTAPWTSFAFLHPTPTAPLPSPTTTVARKDICDPPLVTFVTRETWTTFSVNGSSFLPPLPPLPPPRPPLLPSPSACPPSDALTID